MPDSSFGLFSALIAGAAHIDDPDQIHARAVAAWAILHGYIMLRMNEVINRDGFIGVAEETVLTFATQIDTLQI